MSYVNLEIRADPILLAAARRVLEVGSGVNFSVVADRICMNEQLFYLYSMIV